MFLPISDMNVQKLPPFVIEQSKHSFAGWCVIFYYIHVLFLLQMILSGGKCSNQRKGQYGYCKCIQPYLRLFVKRNSSLIFNRNYCLQKNEIWKTVIQSRSNCWRVVFEEGRWFRVDVIWSWFFERSNRGGKRRKRKLIRLDDLTKFGQTW